MVALNEQCHHQGAKARNSRRRRGAFGCSCKSPTASVSSVNSVACNYYLLQDLLYRAVALTNSSGQIVEAYDCEAYGNTLIFTAPDTSGNWWGDAAVQSNYGANEIIFCGYRYDPESQLHYVRNRTYNPALGRWIQRDPIGYQGGINLYGYVGGRPGSCCWPPLTGCNDYCDIAVGLVITPPLVKPSAIDVGFALIHDLELISLVDKISSVNPVPEGGGQAHNAVANFIRNLIEHRGYSVWIKVKYRSCDGRKWAEHTRYYMLKTNAGSDWGPGVFHGDNTLGRNVTANDLQQAIAPAERNPASCDKGKRPEEYD